MLVDILDYIDESDLESVSEDDIKRAAESQSLLDRRLWLAKEYLWECRDTTKCAIEEEGKSSGAARIAAAEEKEAFKVVKKLRLAITQHPRLIERAERRAAEAEKRAAKAERKTT